MALKNHCYNLLDRQTRGSQFASRCEINFIPLVQIKGLPPKQTEQLLQCQNIAGEAHN